MLKLQSMARWKHGVLQAESVAVKGSSFRVYFPAVEMEPEIFDAGDEGTPTLGGPGLILLVDDEPARRSGLRQGGIISGRGIGGQRGIGRSLLAGIPWVSDFADADPGGGGWGATVVAIEPPGK